MRPGIFLIALLVTSAGCSIGGNEPNPVDRDGDGIPTEAELAHGLDPDDPTDAGLDPDLDGLSNLQEITLYATDIALADTDADGLSDGDEVNVHSTDPLLADTDADALQDGAEIQTFGTNPKASDTDGDTVDDGTEVGGFLIYDKTTRVITNPTAIDTDGDGIHDGIEKSVQEAFAGYGSAQNAVSFLTGPLHPANTTLKPDLGGLSFLDTTQAASALELDHDGDGKPTIEELFHGTNPNDAASEFLYAGEQDASGALTPRFQAMLDANFVYIPGGWDADGDAVVENGFFLAKYEARSANVPVSDTTALGGLLSAESVYDSTLQRFKSRLCDNSNGGDGTDSDSTDNTGACRGNRYQLASSSLAVANAVQQVTFAPAGTPYVALTPLQARLALRSSPVNPDGSKGGPYPIGLPSEQQALQVVRLAINNPANWVGGVVGTGALVQGHSDNSPAHTLSVGNANDAYDQTGNSSASGAGQRRTLKIRNGIMARDFSVPLTHEVEIWDFAGNAAEWTSGIVSANALTSAPAGRAGGDRFANGLSELESYTGSNVSGPAGDISSMPVWWKPILVTGTILGVTTGVGTYHDGFGGSDLNGDGKSDGGFTNENYGYGAESYGDGFVNVARGGHFALGSVGGLAHADLQNGLGRSQAQTGFRASAAN